MLLLARTTPLNEVKKKTEGLSVFLLDMRKAKGNGLTIRPIRTMMNHSTTEVFFDNLRIPATNLVGEENKGFKYILSGMNAEDLIAAECIGDASQWFTKKSQIMLMMKYLRKSHWSKSRYPVPNSKGICANESS